MSQGSAMVFLAAILAGCASTGPRPGVQKTAAPGAPGASVAAGAKGIYLTPAKAYQMWQAPPHHVRILDVRTTGEYIFVGHAPMARNIPVRTLTGRWDAGAGKPVMELNPDFISAVKRTYRPEETILVMCRSGRRGMEAVALMQAAGFANAANIDGGFEGEGGKDCDCPSAAKPIKPGWKTSRLPWTYDLDPRLMYLTEEAKPTASAPGPTTSEATRPSTP